MFFCKCRQKSFTLIEIIIVITIIGILTASGVGAYQNLKYRYSFESNYQILLKYLNNARQYALTNTKIKDSTDNLVNANNFSVFLDKSNNQIFFKADNLNLDTISINSRYSFDFLEISDVDGSQNPLNTNSLTINFQPFKNGVAIQDASSGALSAIVIALKDKEVAAREKKIYINALAGVPVEIK
ncbi:MAG: hypothetical protein UR28_C0021G0022 [Candidatus Peregrinibacteria bacterium GW2011_GWF2_33_10]|nr:MAG: hypothetical protein UR28_C0021G0022 [Candidatus Peregrinibacteria bacterium GW2011_GWF2_33_10]OGJ44368.1 MAG: hypothetical protein A2263_05765 [Candidatus Peregrinibacteria bacterium RIFOXYA2_FULL_33_21]OGJ46397.1 MAG: hypothetical protein A2272_01695 [Candidatus Peregrinibacteria bacterium RIFOXYA12_FULL_33_12]OGJ50163.1 MAG: hypothetical protein A2307_03255 [Candidatus Peregrinibacteria bacterium RIFOXYB2_FULL_33_20]